MRYLPITAVIICLSLIAHAMPHLQGKPTSEPECIAHQCVERQREIERLRAEIIALRFVCKARGKGRGGK